MFGKNELQREQQYFSTGQKATLSSENLVFSPFEDFHHKSFTGREYDLPKFIIMPTSSQTAITSPSEQDREKVKEYWKSSGFGLSRLETASEFELARLQETQHQKNQGIGLAFHILRRLRKKP
jgi:hypothetical protein